MKIPDIAGEAETLIRALQGVRHARIATSDGDIEAVHVTARDEDAARHMAAHVRSALLAGLAAPVLLDSIHVRVDDDAPEDGASPEGDARAAASTDQPRHDDPRPRLRIRLLEDTPAGPAGEDTRGESTSGQHDGEHVREAPVEVQEPVRPSITARPRLVAVDADRPGDGRVLCRVAIAFRTRVHRAEAVAVDLPGAAAQAAAQATVRALLDAGLPGLELGGLREVEIAGREYVLVALRRTEPHTRHRSGSAPIIGSPERSAAEATVAAACDMT